MFLAIQATFQVLYFTGMVYLQALRSKYFLVGQNLNTNAQSTAVSRPPQPVAPHPPNKRSNAAAHQLNSQNHEINVTKLGKASYKKFSTASQFGHILNDVSSGSVNTRQPTPGISENMALLDTSLDNFRTSKSNVAANLGSKSDLQKSAASSEKEASIKGSLTDSKPVKEGNNTEPNRGHHRLPNITSKFPLPIQQPQPLWQAVNKPPFESKRTLYNPVVFGAGARHAEDNHKQQQVWGRIRRDTVADVEGVPVSEARKPQDG